MLVDEKGNPITATSGLSIIITCCEEQRILDFMQGSVYAHCAYNSDKEFCFKYLFGGNSRIWDDTPLQVLYNMHFNGGNRDEAKELAAKDGGKLLKRVIIREPRKTFVLKKAETEISLQYKLKLEATK